MSESIFDPKYMSQVGLWKKASRLERYKNWEKYKEVQSAYNALEKACAARNAKEIEAKCKIILSREHQSWIPQKDKENLKKILSMLH